jgi:hypothetical protein
MADTAEQELVAQQIRQEGRNAQQSNYQECVWSAGHVRRIKNRQ